MEHNSGVGLVLKASGARRHQGERPKGQDTTQWRGLVHDNRPGEGALMMPSGVVWYCGINVEGADASIQHEETDV